MRRLLVVARALVALLVLIGLLVAVPTALLVLVGNPVPAGGPESLSGPIGDDVIMGALAVVAWFFWAQMVLCVLVELIGQLRGADMTGRLPRVMGPQQQLARVLIGALLVVGVGSTVATGFAPHVQAAEPAQQRSTSRVASTRVVEQDHTVQVTSAAAASATRDEQHDGAVRFVTTKAGDSLWELAQRHLGGGEQWRRIADLNDGRVMPDGARFTASSTVIQPGWELKMPADAVGLPAHTGDVVVRVKAGDTLSGIAQAQLGDAEQWPGIAEASHLSDPDLIHPGDQITLPGTAGHQVGGVQHKPAGDDLSNHQDQHHATPHQPAQHGRAGLAARRGVGAAGAAPTGHIPGHQVADPAPQSPPTQAPRDATHGAPRHTASHAGAQSDGAQTPSWMLVGLTGAGGVLAVSLSLMLRARRRTQFRSRRPGRMIAPPGPELGKVERSVMVAPATGPAQSVAFMDAALRRLAAAHAAAGTPMPSVAGVELTGVDVVLHLSAPCSLEGPWVGDEQQLRWSLVLPADDEVPELGEDQAGAAATEAPFPLLVTVGKTVAGDLWLLNTEVLGTLSLTGDPGRRAAFARYVAAEIAVNVWSANARVDCIGMCAEVAAMNPSRVQFHESGPAAAQILTDVVGQARETVERARDHQVTDAATGRVTGAAEDTWTTRLLLIDATGQGAGSSTVGELVGLVAGEPGRTSTAVLLSGAPATGAVVVELDKSGALRMPGIGLELDGVGLSTEEAQGIAALLEHSSEVVDVDVEVPTDPDATQGWQAWADNAGALRTEHTMARENVEGNHPDPGSAGSVLGDVDQAYLATAAATAAELQDLAPRVTVEVRAGVEDADPTLDADLAAWRSAECDLPKLALLGPVKARTRGAALASRKPYYTEVLAYLAVHPHGAGSDQMAEDLAITRPALRNAMKIVREWLGTNPRTGAQHVPAATKTRAAQERGAPAYQVDDLLVDVDLFRRLRVRGIARGADGAADLLQALTLVTGQPFCELRPGGWGWLSEGQRLDQVAMVAVVDVAHTLTTKALGEGDLKLARSTAEIALLAAPNEEVARLNLAKVTAAEGHEREAEAMLATQVFNRTEDGQPPVELSARTSEVLENWRAHQAS